MPPASTRRSDSSSSACWGASGSLGSRGLTAAACRAPPSARSLRSASARRSAVRAASHSLGSRGSRLDRDAAHLLLAIALHSLAVDFQLVAVRAELHRQLAHPLVAPSSRPPPRRSTRARPGSACSSFAASTSSALASSAPPPRRPAAARSKLSSDPPVAGYPPRGGLVRITASSPPV